MALPSRRVNAVWRCDKIVLPVLPIALLASLLAISLLVTVPAASAVAETGQRAIAADPFEGAVEVDLPDGLYRIDVDLEGGSGRASVDSPAEYEVYDSRGAIKLEWSSSHFDYLVLDGYIYYPVNTSGNSVFVIPVAAYDEPIGIIADTTAMSEAHEIEYSLTVYRDTAEYIGDEDSMDLVEADSAVEGAEGVEGGSAAGSVWPWIVFAICIVLSVACIAGVVILLRGYRSST